MEMDITWVHIITHGKEMEIEKKYRLNVLPEPEILGVGKLILQGYLYTDPFELRVRQYGNKYYLTIKSDQNEAMKLENVLKRKEWNKEIPKWVFKSLWPHTEKCRIEKTR